MTQKQEQVLEPDMTVQTKKTELKQDTGVADSGVVVRKSSLKEWWLKFWYEEFELTVFFQGKTTILPDGSRVTEGAPKTWRVKNIKKLSPKHIIFIDIDKRKHEIKTTEPVGYNLTKIY
jgi:hypothetical protein